MLTKRQRTVLVSLLSGAGYTAKEMGVRSDVLWRLEEKGFVVRTLFGDVWYITGSGRREVED